MMKKTGGKMKMRFAGKSLIKLSFLLVLSFFISLTLGAQAKPSLQILPMTGGSDPDGANLIVILGREGALREGFSLTPGTGNFERIIEELRPAKAGAAEIRRRFNSDYVLLAHTEQLEHGRIALIALVETASLRLLGGWYGRYYSPRDLLPPLPDIARELAEAAETAEDKPKLAVAPFSSSRYGRAKLLTYLVSLEIAREGVYAVCPWALTAGGLSTQSGPRGGIMDGDYLSAVRRKTGAPYILTGDILSLGTSRRLMSSILNTRDGRAVSEANRDYRILAEDMAVLPELAALLAEPWPEAADPPEDLVLIEPGTFSMGSPPWEAARDGDEGRRRVPVGGFYLGRYEVTQGEYEAVMGANPSRFRGADLPVEGVSWYDAILYCNARSLREGLSPVYTIGEREIVRDPEAGGYRLPTEAEWEYACRAGTETAFNRGAAITTAEANYDGNYPYNKSGKGVFRRKTTAVGSFAPNDWGLYDMHGNVYEWCWDAYGPYAAGTSLESPIAAEGLIRGGSWYSEGRFLRSANRARAHHSGRADYIGFRVARSAE
jgi:formylglycine-generating enzyme required for sulfatase activity